MRTVTGFPLAQGTGTDGAAIPQLTLVFNGVVPSQDAELSPDQFVAAHQAFYGAEARRFLAELLKSAPGGFIDALFGELAHQKASVFRVPHQS